MIILETPKHPILGAGREASIQRTGENFLKTRRDLDKLLGRLGFGIPKRQTVLMGKLDMTVYPHVPSCLAINGSNIDIKATDSEPMIISFAGGFDEYGAIDIIKTIKEDVPSAWGSFAQNQRYFLYIDVDDDGVITYGKTIIPPQYGTLNRHHHSLLHFEGTDGSDVFTDEWGHPWSHSNDAQIDTDQHAFSSDTSSLKLDGVDDDIYSDFNPMGRQRWTHEIWVRPTDGTLLQTIFRGYPTYSLALVINASGYLVIYAAYGNSSSWNLCGGTGAAVGTHAFADNTWEHIALEQQYDEQNDNWILRAYKGGALECYSPTYTQPIGEFAESASQYFKIGRDSGGTQDFGGHMDEYRFTLGACRYGAPFTPATSMFGTGDGDVHWFNIDRMEMNVGYPGAWTKKTRVFVGEVATRLDSSTIERLTIYQYQNKYIGAPTWMSAGTLAYAWEHNCGIPFEGGLKVTPVYGINDTMTSSKIGFNYAASGYGLYSAGHGGALYTTKESWRHLVYTTSSTYIFEWDAYSRWSPYVFMQPIITRDW